MWNMTKHLKANRPKHRWGIILRSFLKTLGVRVWSKIICRGLLSTVGLFNCNTNVSISRKGAEILTN